MWFFFFVSFFYSVKIMLTLHFIIFLPNEKGQRNKPLLILHSTLHRQAWVVCNVMKDKGLECNGTKQTKRQIHHNVVLLEVKGIEGTCHWFISLPLNYN